MKKELLAVYLVNANDESKGSWISLPKTKEEVSPILNDLGIHKKEDYLIKDCKSDYLDTGLLAIEEYSDLNKVNWLADLLEIPFTVCAGSDEGDLIEVILREKGGKSLHINIMLIVNSDDFWLYPDILDEEDLGREFANDWLFEIPEDQRTKEDYINLGKELSKDAESKFLDEGYFVDSGLRKNKYRGIPEWLMLISE